MSCNFFSKCSSNDQENSCLDKKKMYARFSNTLLFLSASSSLTNEIAFPDSDAQTKAVLTYTAAFSFAMSLVLGGMYLCSKSDSNSNNEERHLLGK